MIDYSTAFAAALPYKDYLSKYGTAEQQQRWQSFHEALTLTDAQRELLQSFRREMKVLVLAGAWCGDCVNQCPIFERFAEASSCIQIRYLDRDDSGGLTQELTTCGGARVPTVVFLSEDAQFCGRYGDKTLSKFRSLVRSLDGASCPTGLGGVDSLTAEVVQDWLNEFERIQWMLRTSARLRQVHGD